MEILAKWQFFRLKKINLQYKEQKEKNPSRQVKKQKNDFWGPQDTQRLGLEHSGSISNIIFMFFHNCFYHYKGCSQGFVWKWDELLMLIPTIPPPHTLFNRSKVKTKTRTAFYSTTICINYVCTIGWVRNLEENKQTKKHWNFLY